MQKVNKVVIIAGEESGDLHAAKLIGELRKTHPSIQISGIGGQHMQDAGAEIISDLARFGVTGLTEVFRYLGVIKKAMKDIKHHLAKERPDLLILVDYPGFNLRLAKYAKKKLNIRILYYISPQIWAWKAKRIHLIKECVDQMAVILPFEKALYQKADVPVHFVGHPLIEKLAGKFDPIQCRKNLHLPTDKYLIALLPGSRTNEIERHMPILRDTALALQSTYPDMHFAIPIARTINRIKIQSYFKNTPISISFIEDQALACMSAADFVVVASGTASLECALLEKPMCIIYKSSLLTYIAAMKLIKVRFLGLCNLLANKMIVPEFLQYDCNATELVHYIQMVYNDADQSHKMIKELADLKNNLSSNRSDCSLIDLVEKELTEINAYVY
ncbi:MAG: lipid-A-disaccharide synthase [Legionella sp.]|nr:MAG: lipid-A-disaccharide synthase [Legionella sp.]